MKTLRWNRIVFWVILLTLCAGFSLSATAEEITLVPLVDVSGGYDDNVYYSRLIEKSDYVASGKPGFIFNYDSERYTVRTRGSVDFLRYRHNTNLNRENYYAFFDGGVSLTERMTFRADFSYVNDTTLDSQLEETGIVTLRTDRKRYSGGAELAYQLSMRSNAGLSVNHQSIRYGSALYEDYDYDALSGYWDYSFNDGLDRFTVMPYYGHWNSNMSTVNNYGLSFGYSHAFSETFSIKAFVGPRYTQTERKYTVPVFEFDPDTGSFRLVMKEMTATDSNFGGTGNIEVNKRWENSSLSGGYSHDLTYSSSIGDDAEPINVDRFFLGLTHKITSRFRGGLNASYYISESASSFGNQNRRYVTVTPFVDYALTRNFSLRLSYSYQRQLNERLDSDPGLDRNRVWLTFTGRWPFKW